MEDFILLITHYRSSQLPEASYKKDFLKNFAIFIGKYLCWSLFFNRVYWKEILTWVFSCEYCEISVLTKTRNDPKRPTTSKKQPETTYNDLKIPATNTKRPGNNLPWARNDLKRPTTSKTPPTTTRTYLQRAKQRRETTDNKQILRLFHNMGQTALFSNTFFTQHLVAIIWVLLHGESWW